MQSFQEMPRYRLFGSLRFVLALMVALSHSLMLWNADPNGFVGLLQAIGLGNPAVMGFFVLSGFIITEAASTFYRKRPLAFLINRFWRIAPPYWAALLVSAAVHFALVRAGIFKVTDVGTPTAGMFSFNNLLGNVLGIVPRPRIMQIDVPEGYYGFVRFSWAVYIEVQFYLAAFVVLLAGSALGHIRSFALAAGGAVLAAHAISEYVVPLKLSWELSFAPYFVLGAALSCRQSLAVRLGVGLAYVLAILHFSRYVQGKPALTAEWASGLLHAPKLLAILIMASIPIAIVALSRVSLGKSAASTDRKLGDLSYPLYLNHFVVLVVAVSIGISGPLAVGAAILVSIALSFAMKEAVERPIRPLRDRVRGQRLEASASDLR